MPAPEVTPQLSVIIPAHNEAACIGDVIEELLDFFEHCPDAPTYELIVVDNASTDNTAVVALQAGGHVIFEPKKGYGQACWAGINASHGELLLFIDADGAANTADIPLLLTSITAGADLVVGIRQQPQPGAMTFTQRFGNALAVWLIQRLWGLPVTDLGPLRLIRRCTFDALNMLDRSFGWTVEMQVKAYLQGAVVVNVPVDWRARRAGQSKISGTVHGVIGAGLGIIGMIARLWLRERTLSANYFRSTSTNQARREEYL